MCTNRYSETVATLAVAGVLCWVNVAAAQEEEAPPAPPPRHLLGWPAAPLEDPLVTDRPDFTESTLTVPYGHFQLEGGYTFTYDREHHDRRREHTAPELLLRVGIVEDFELRFGWEGYAVTSSNFRTRNDKDRIVSREEWDQGARDVDIGFKLGLVKEEGLRPALAVIGSLSTPSGSPNQTVGDVEPSAALLWSHSLGERLSLAGQFIIAAPIGDEGRFVQTAASISLGVALTERWGAYFEYFGFYPNTERTDSAHSLNGGVTYLITDNFQVDMRAGFGLNEEADDFFSGVGFAWRF
jgi:hypothetical protein